MPPCGRRTHTLRLRRSFAFPPEKVRHALSSRKTSRKSAPLRGGLCGTHLRPITGRHALVPTSSTRTTHSVPYGSPASSGSGTGLPCFAHVTYRVRLQLFPGGFTSVRSQCGKERPATHHFGQGLSAPLAFSH